MNIHYPFDWTPRWFTQQFSSWVIRAACQLGFCSTINELVHILETYSRGGESGQIVISFALVPIINVYVACVNLIYLLPQPNPLVFKDFEAYKSIYSTTRITNLTGVVSEIDWMNTIGYR